MDFETVQHATEALIDPRNYLLNGRKLTIQYASIDAARRGGFGKGEGKLSAKGGNGRKGGKPKTDGDVDADADDATEEVSEPFVPKKIDINEPEEKKHKPNQAERRAARKERELSKTKGHSNATKASKEIKTSSASNYEGVVLPSLGKKIVFD